MEGQKAGLGHGRLNDCRAPTGNRRGARGGQREMRGEKQLQVRPWGLSSASSSVCADPDLGGLGRPGVCVPQTHLWSPRHCWSPDHLWVARIWVPEHDYSYMWNRKAGRLLSWEGMQHLIYFKEGNLAALWKIAREEAKDLLGDNRHHGGEM